PIFILRVPRSWSASLLLSERTIERCFICLATVGSSSLISMPLAAVGLGLNSPPVGWPGFRSHRSRWLGPPPIHRMMRLFPCFLRSGAIARRFDTNCTAGSDAAVSPARCLRKCRRCMPMDIGIPLNEIASAAVRWDGLPQASVAQAFELVKKPLVAAAMGPAEDGTQGRQREFPENVALR